MKSAIPTIGTWKCEMLSQGCHNKIPGKSGQSLLGSKSVYYLIIAVILTILTFTLYGLGNGYTASQHYVDDDVVQEMMAERAITCFSTTEGGRTVPILVPGMMTQSRLSTCFSSMERGIRVMLEDRTSHQVIADIHTGGRVGTIRVPYPVLYLESGKVRSGTLKIDISR